MEHQTTRQGFRNISIAALFSFLVSIVFCTFLVSTTIVNRIDVSKLRTEQQMLERILGEAVLDDSVVELIMTAPQPQRWYNYPENIALILAGLCICFIVFFVMQYNYQLKNMQRVFETMAITDPLTGIFNRRHFLEIARISIEKARRHNEDCYFIMFDIDLFKNVNDTYGHQIGDKVLMDVTARIRSDIRPYDLFARYGGEEFIIFTNGITKKEVCEMVERLRLSLCTRQYKYDDIVIESSASFGIAHMNDYDIDKAIKQSDESLYDAKRSGRNCYAYYGDKDTPRCKEPQTA